MNDMSLNIFDLGVAIVIGLSALLSFYRGFVREIMSLGGWLAASFVTLKFLEPATLYIKPQIKSEVIASGVAAVGLFFITLIVVSIATNLLMKALKPADRVGLLDNLAGLAFGVARGTLIVSIAFFVMTIAVVEKDYPDWVKDAYTRPYVAACAKWLKTLTPDYLEKIGGEAKDDADDLGDASKEKVHDLIKKLDKTRDATTKKINHMEDTKEKPDTDDDSGISMEDLQQRLREENEKKDVR